MAVNVAEITMSKEELKRLVHILVDLPQGETPDNFVLYVKPDHVNFCEWQRHPIQLIDPVESQPVS